MYLSEQATPQPELKRSEALNKACRDHVLDIGPSGGFVHDGKDGSTPESRAQKYISGGSSKVENLAFIDERSGLSAEPESVISQMIINDGELDRDTRKNVLSQEFTHIGIACGCHSVIGEVCCFAYGKDINDGNQSPSQPLYDVPKE